MQQPRDDVRILLAPPAIRCIKAVDALKIGAPDREIAGARALPAAFPNPAQWTERNAQDRGKAIGTAAQALGNPADQTPAFDGELLLQHFRGERRREQDAIARHERTALCKSPVHRDEIRPRDAVAVEENTIAAARGQDRAVANLGGAKALVGMPDMIEPPVEFGLPLADQTRRGGTGAVVGNDHLEVRICLPRERSEDRIECVLAVESGDDDGDQLGHGALSSRL